MNWNDAAEELLNNILLRTPRPVRETTEQDIRRIAEQMAEEESKQRVGVETVIAAWIETTPETLRSALPQQMESFGLDPSEYEHLLG
ncbi:MAG TPA: PCP reductase family protein [Bryobacteraceae bacterium]|nr:PCP reductase family protein [Bryobacteraceae bacterium]